MPPSRSHDCAWVPRVNVSRVAGACNNVHSQASLVLDKMTSDMISDERNTLSSPSNLSDLSFTVSNSSVSSQTRLRQGDLRSSTLRRNLAFSILANDQTPLDGGFNLPCDRIAPTLHAVAPQTQVRSSGSPCATYRFSSHLVHCLLSEHTDVSSPSHCHHACRSIYSC